MVQLEVPHISVLTKVDLLQDKVQWLRLSAAKAAFHLSAVLCILFVSIDDMLQC